MLASCAGGTGIPWGLDEVTGLPDDGAEIAAVFTALPEEIAGLTRSGDPIDPGRPVVSYGREIDRALVLDAIPVQAIAAEAGATLTPLEYLLALPGDVEVEGRSLNPDAGVVWVAAVRRRGTDPVEIGYVAAWGDPEGQWVFEVTAATPEGRSALVNALLEALRG
jgi:hypothetical protein